MNVPDMPKPMLPNAVLAEAISSCVEEKPDHGLYAIIDLARLDNPDQWLEKIKRTPGAHNLYSGQPEASAERLAPWLWPISRERREIGLSASLALEVATYAAASWIVTSLPGAELAHRLSRRMTASVHGKEALFRFYDPRLLPTIQAHLSEDQSTSFLALGEGCWFLIDEKDDLMQIGLYQGNDTFAPPFPVSQRLAESLQVASENTQVLALLARAWPDQWAAWPEQRRRAYGRELLLEAQQRGVESFHRKAWYCRGKIARKSLPMGEHWRT